MKEVLPWIFLIAVWMANINDLIRGNWFYETTTQIIFMNIIGILSLFLILYSRSHGLWKEVEK